MIMEAHGGSWGEDARLLFHELSKSAARLTGDSPSEKLEQYLQSLSVSLHRANARAVLRRAPVVLPAVPAVAAAQAALAAAQAERSAAPLAASDAV